MRSLLLVVGAFVVMEPLTYLTHRFVMHGLGRRLHRSHHRRWPRRRLTDPFLEANDTFPVLFAGVTVVALAVGFQLPGFGALVPLCIGVTLYGAAYAFVHDVYAHGRLPYPFRHRVLDALAAAHELHHRFGGEPYGMLVPIVPAERRRRAKTATARSERAARAPSAQGPRPVPRP